MKNNLDFKIRLKISEDNVVMSYSQNQMELLKPQIAADLLYVLREKHMHSDKFFEYNPANFADLLLANKTQLEFNKSYNDKFIFFKQQVISSIINNASKDENDFHNIFESLYKYKDVISNIETLESNIEYKIKNSEIQFKDISILQDLNPLTAMSFPAYCAEFLNKKYARENKKPFKNVFSISNESKIYVYENFTNAIDNFKPDPFSYISYYLKDNITSSVNNINQLFNCLKTIDAVNIELNKELNLDQNDNTTKKVKP